MAMAVLATDTARGLLMPMPTMAAMAVTAMAVLATDTARGPLMLMPTMAATAMVAMDMVVLATAMARGPLMLMLTMGATAMAATATAVLAMATASNLISKDKIYLQISIPDLNLFIGKSKSYHELKKLKYTQFL